MKFSLFCPLPTLPVSLLLHFYSWRVQDKQEIMLSRTVLSSTSENFFWRWETGLQFQIFCFVQSKLSTRWKKAGFPAALVHSLDSALLLMYLSWTHHSDQTPVGTLLGARHLGYAPSHIWTTGILHCALLVSSVCERKACNLTSKVQMSDVNWKASTDKSFCCCSEGFLGPFLEDSAQVMF